MRNKYSIIAVILVCIILSYIFLTPYLYENYFFNENNDPEISGRLIDSTGDMIYIYDESKKTIIATPVLYEKNYFLQITSGNIRLQLDGDGNAIDICKIIPNGLMVIYLILMVLYTSVLFIDDIFLAVRKRKKSDKKIGDYTIREIWSGVIQIIFFPFLLLKKSLFFL